MPGSYDLNDDPRWHRFNDGSWTCAGCNELHRGIFDLGCSHPDAWPADGTRAPNADVVGSTQILTEDFCIFENTYFFIRCVLLLPIQGTDQMFGYGVWSSLSRKNFDIYLEHFDSGNYQGHGPWFGWFSNRLTGYAETFNLKGQVHPRNGRQRPFIELEPIDHPLVREQQNGISFDRLLEIYALHGHDFSQT